MQKAVKKLGKFDKRLYYIITQNNKYIPKINSSGFSVFRSKKQKTHKIVLN